MCLAIEGSKDGLEGKILASEVAEVGILRNSSTESLNTLGYFTRARGENGLQVVGESIGVGHSSKSLCCGYIILVEDLSEGSTISVDALEVLCSLCVIATSNLEVAKHFIVVASGECLA